MKPSIPKGTRDFGPKEVARRNFIFDIMRKVFVKYGYQPIETPAMENLNTLTGKYGEEGDKLLFKVLNNGDFLVKADAQALEAKDSQKLAPSIARRGMRYDLTVPFARYVVQHQNDISFPFKRYQIQPVWRGDRPQKGRYQEFYQCDVDVVGSTSLMLEAELVQIYDEVFDKLGLDVTIKINNRKILAGMAEAAGILDQFIDMTVAIDKLDKIGIEGVRKEMGNRGIPESAIDQIEKMLSIDSLDKLKPLFANSEQGQKGIEELQTVFDFLDSSPTKNTAKFEITLARGLSYYTGFIVEVEANDVEMGSIGGGGRYDDLTGNFGLKNVSGVGVSFGAARIYDCMTSLDIFPQEVEENLEILLISEDTETHRYAFNCLNKFRTADLNAELYPDPVKFKKQMKYANDRQVKFVAIAGGNELANNTLTLKNMETGEQETYSVDAIIDLLTKD